jgi:Na+/melibiose symporter-like transporter
MAFFLQPALGYFSDKCTSGLGRRKPFILVLGITSFIGVTFLLNGDLINQSLGFNMNV